MIRARSIAAWALAASLSLLLPGPRAVAEPNAPGTVSFEVLRNGRPFGRQSVSVTRSGDQLVAATSADLRANLGPVSLFRYAQSCRETWVSGALHRLNCTTTRGGRTSPVSGAVQGGVFQVQGPRGAVSMPAPAWPTSWWTRPALTTTVMVNTETGTQLPVRISLIGRETIDVGGRQVQADHIRVAGTLVVDLWYDAAGHWVGCAFSVNGQRMSYRLLSDPERAPA